ncbi:hypothetical protein BD410DRAFT_690423, partial [Rickenella mellea]
DTSAFPEWLVNALAFIIKQDVKGVVWEAVINMWVELERRLGFPTTDASDPASRLDTKHRPAQVSTWIRSGRPYNKVPPIADPAEYGNSWRKWWKGLQPKWRDAGVDWPLRDGIAGTEGAWTGEKWPGVAKGGKNGFHIVIVTLVWWNSVATEPADRRAFAVALVDVEWCLCQVVEALKLKGKRAA